MTIRCECLSSVDQHSRQIGSEAARLVLEALKSKVVPAPEVILLPPELVVRASTQRRSGQRVSNAPTRAERHQAAGSRLMDLCGRSLGNYSPTEQAETAPGLEKQTTSLMGIEAPCARYRPTAAKFQLQQATLHPGDAHVHIGKVACRLRPPVYPWFWRRNGPVVLWMVAVQSCFFATHA